MHGERRQRHWGMGGELKEKSQTFSNYKNWWSQAVIDQDMYMAQADWLFGVSSAIMWNTRFDQCCLGEGWWQITASWPPHPAQQKESPWLLIPSYIKTLYGPCFVLEHSTSILALIVSSKYGLQLNTVPFLKKVLTNAVFFPVLLFWKYFSTSSYLVSWAAAGQSSC